MFKINKKKWKKCLISARGHVEAMWHSGPRGSATRAHAVYAFIYLCYIVYIYNGYSQPSVDRKGIRTIKSVGRYKPDGFTDFFHVGLSPTQCFKCRPRGGMRDIGSTAHRKSTCRPRGRGPPIDQSRTCLFKIFRDVAASHTSITWCADHRSRSKTRAI